MVFDGDCSFCIYWIIKWKKISADSIAYVSYQEAHNSFKDISIESFKEAVRLIETDGTVFSGADAAYYTYYLKGKFKFLHLWYQKYHWFKRLSDFIYRWIAKRRNFMFKLSVTLFGTHPEKPNKNWMIFLLALFLIIALATYNLTSTSKL